MIRRMIGERIKRIGYKFGTENKDNIIRRKMIGEDPFAPDLNAFPYTLTQWKDELDTQWQRALIRLFDEKDFEELYEWVSSEYANFPCNPTPENIFAAFRLTPFTSIKVVIIGLDPYHTPNEAMGLAFSVPKDSPIPPSLRNIYKNIKADKKIIFEIPEHGDLTPWASQGVLLLNGILTVRQGIPFSHSRQKWEKFTDSIIQAINRDFFNVVFMLWGTFAQQKEQFIDPSKHLILKTSHPSPLSASQGFAKSQHFSEANDYLKSHCLKEINWAI